MRKIKHSIQIKAIISFVILFTISNISYSQCCAVGGGSPLAGDVSKGVLQHYQFEVSSNLQYVSTNKFLFEDRDTANFLKSFNSTYLYSRLAYGLSDRLTMSVETGYWLEKNQIGIKPKDSYQSYGISDILVFPRYSIVKPSINNKFKELTIGMGIKMPIGQFNDSIGLLEPFSGQTFYMNKPPAVQATTGAQDVLFNVLYISGLPATKIKFSANLLYIIKGWNPLGEKLGNFASIGFFAGGSFFEKINAAIQLKAEWIEKMELNPDILIISFPNFDPQATGSRKVFLSPQLSYVFRGKIIAFLQSDIPVYQYVNKAQAASQIQITAGLSYRFTLKQKTDTKPIVPFIP